MPFSVRYDSNNKCLMASMEGEIDIKTIQEFAKEVVQKAKKHNCKKMLNDVRNINIKLSTVDIYSLPKYAYESGVDMVYKRALVASNDFDDVAFFETVSVNKAQNVRVFRNPEDALEWLQDDN